MLIPVKLEGNDYQVAMKMLVWASYPDRPHMRERERDQTAMRDRSLTDLGRKIALEHHRSYHVDARSRGTPEPKLPRDQSGRLITKNRIEERIGRIDLNFRHSFELGYEIQFAVHPAKIVDDEIIPDFTKTIISNALSYLEVSGSATNTSIKRQYRDRVRGLVEPLAPACHLALAMGMEGKADLHRREMLMDLLLRAPQWVDSALEAADALIPNTLNLAPGLPAFSFYR